jgi:hypothetical protein
MGEGLASFRNRLRRLPDAIRDGIRGDLIRGGEVVADAVRALAPEDDGDLIASVAVTGPGDQTPAYSQPGGSMTVPENSAAVTVGNEAVRYPHLQEYGTSFHAAHPYFWPGFRLARSSAVAAVTGGMRKIIRGGK